MPPRYEGSKTFCKSINTFICLPMPNIIMVFIMGKATVAAPVRSIDFLFILAEMHRKLIIIWAGE
jgi:hypothetical protein